MFGSHRIPNPHPALGAEHGLRDYRLGESERRPALPVSVYDPVY